MKKIQLQRPLFEKIVESQISEIYGRRVRVKFQFKSCSPNGNTFKWGIKTIKVYGNWLDMASSDYRKSRDAKLAFLMTIGHELGHTDDEPPIFSPLPSTFRNHIRELRADYCGILFTLHYLKKYYPNISITREELLKIRYDYSFEHTLPKFREADCSHPSLKKRYEVLLQNPNFTEDLIRKISKEYSVNDAELNKLCKQAMRGKLLHLGD